MRKFDIIFFEVDTIGTILSRREREGYLTSLVDADAAVRQRPPLPAPTAQARHAQPDAQTDAKSH